MRDWSRTLATIRPLLAAVYAPATLLLLALLSGALAPGPTERPADAGLFWVLLAVAVADLPLSLAVGARLLRFDSRPPAGAAPDRAAVLAAAAARLRASTLVTAALGTLVAGCGLLHHLAGGRREQLIYFLALTGAHAALTSSLAGKAVGALRDLAGRP